MKKDQKTKDTHTLKSSPDAYGKQSQPFPCACWRKDSDRSSSRPIGRPMGDRESSIVVFGILGFEVDLT